MLEPDAGIFGGELPVGFGVVEIAVTEKKSHTSP